MRGSLAKDQPTEWFQPGALTISQTGAQLFRGLPCYQFSYIENLHGGGHLLIERQAVRPAL